MHYRHEIDGLRAIAVIPVILFHAGFNLFSGGYVGVDIFFVISGYLITGIIIRELNSGNFSIRRFYERRARRILPALFFVMLSCIPFAWMWMLPSQFKDFSQSLVAVSIFASNILFSYKHGYFTETAIQEKPLLHTWSLGVEEQYYVLFPLALIFLWRFGKNPVFYCIATAAIISLLFSEWGWRNAPNFNFYLATSRAWELFAGSICALAQFENDQKKNDFLSLTGILLICFSIFYYDETTPFPSVYALVPVLGTCLIILYGAGGTFVARVLSYKAFTAIGLISYSAYLWHQPLFAFARIKYLYPPDKLLMAALSGLALVLAYASWKYIEKPFRRIDPLNTRRSVRFFAGSLLLMIGIIGVGLYGHFSNGREKSWENSVSAEISQMYKLISDAKNANLHLPQDNGKCKFNIEKIDDENASRIIQCFEKFGRGIAVLGDSHAIDLFGSVSSFAKSEFVVGITQGYCRPHDTLEFCQYKGFHTFIARHQNVFSNVIFEQTGRTLLLDEKGKSGSDRMFTDYRMNESLPRYSVHIGNVAKVYEYLLSLSNYTNVIWLGSRIEPHISGSFMLKSGCDFKYELRKNQTEIFQQLDKATDGLVRSRYKGDKLLFVSQISLVNFDINNDFTSCEHLYWSDGDHWSAHGEKLFGQRLKKLLINLPDD